MMEWGKGNCQRVCRKGEGEAERGNARRKSDGEKWAEKRGRESVLEWGKG